MKITKILFLGIVAVMLSVGYLAAQTADTVWIRTTPGQPGGMVTVTVEMSINSTGITGVVNAINDLPAGFTVEGTDWYSWGEGYGAVMQSSSTAPAPVSLSNGLLSASVLFINVDNLISGGDLASSQGTFITYNLDVASDMEFGEYTYSADPASNVVIQGFAQVPTTVIADPIVIADIPAYNALQSPSDLDMVMSGGSFDYNVMIENKDAVGQGSFSVTFPDVLTLNSVSAGSRAGGASLAIDDQATDAGMTVANVSFSGGSIPAGGLGTLASLAFDVSALSGPNQSVTITLADVVLQDGSGAAVSDLQQPSSADVMAGVYYADTVWVNVAQGEGMADIDADNLTLTVPVRLKNMSSVSSIRLYIQEDAEYADLISLSEVQVMGGAAALTVSSVDNGDNVQVIAYAATSSDVVAAGDDDVINVVYNIAESVRESWSADMDIDLMLKGVEVIDAASGEFLGVQQIDGVATIDSRVPNEGENANGGATLPKAFALGQNSPNPFNPSTTIQYQIPEGAGVSFTLNVYDIRGRLIRTLDSGVKAPGFYRVQWDGTDNSGRHLSSGVYFYRFSSKDYNSTRKMVLLK